MYVGTVCLGILIPVIVFDPTQFLTGTEISQQGVVLSQGLGSAQELDVVASDWAFHMIGSHLFLSIVRVAKQLISDYGVLMAGIIPGTVLSGRASFGYSTLASEEKASEK